MGTVNKDLADRARSIFTDLGYRVESDGASLRAERGWKTVDVTPATGSMELPDDSSSFHCFVADEQSVDSLERRLLTRDPDYEWAIIVVDDDDYAVERAPPGAV